MARIAAFNALLRPSMVPRLFSSPHHTRRLVRRVRPVLPLLTVALCYALSNSPARADEWSVVPAGDPIYRQLSIIDQFGDGKTTKTSKGLTRYEAALQVARVITLSGATPSSLPRTGWRAVSDLCQELRPELTQLGIDVAATQAACERNIASLASKQANTSSPSQATNFSSLGGSLGSSLRQGVRPGQNQGVSALRSPLLSSGNVADADALLGLSVNSAQVPISQRLRMDVASLMYKPKTSDPFSTNYTSRTQGSGLGVSYDLGSRFRLRANTTTRDLLGDPSQSPLLSAGLFQGASRVRGTGGGLDANLGSLSLFGDVESLNTDTGERGTIVGGGARLSAWQNRLVISARLSMLKPEERSALASTGTEFGVGVDVWRRLRLNLLYQSLFTQQSVNSSSRLSGGLSMSW